MKPPLFDYARPGTIEEAVALLAAHGGDAKILAGGQSLMPLLNFRLVRPALLVDVNRLGVLDHVSEAQNGLRIGALTRHHTLEMSPLVRTLFPVLAEAMTHVAHLAIRNRGTIGGSLSHADPAAELPLLAVLLDAKIHTAATGGNRVHQARDFFLGPMTTALAEDEIVTEIALPLLPPGTGGGFSEFARRCGDFALAAVAATLTLADGVISEARLAVGGVEARPTRLAEIEGFLIGRHCTLELAAAAARQARDCVQPEPDPLVSPDYRRHLVTGLTERALVSAWKRASDRAS